MSKKEIKTNVMRILDKEKVAYKAHFYEHEEGVAVDGVSVAKMLSQDPERVFKTLVLRGKSKSFYVFVIPVEKELDLKLSASAVGEKSARRLSFPLPTFQSLSVQNTQRLQQNKIAVKAKKQYLRHPFEMKECLIFIDIIFV